MQKNLCFNCVAKKGPFIEEGVDKSICLDCKAASDEALWNDEHTSDYEPEYKESEDNYSQSSDSFNEEEHLEYLALSSDVLKMALARRFVLDANLSETAAIELIKETLEDLFSLKVI